MAMKSLMPLEIHPVCHAAAADMKSASMSPWADTA